MSVESETIKAYQGDDPFIFVSYSHKDRAKVYPQLRWLQAQGFNVWFDEGISPGQRWTDELAEAIENCSLLLFFITPNSVASENCLNEVQFALGRERSLLSVHLETTKLPSGLELSIASRQAIIKENHDTAGYQRALAEAVAIELTNGPGVAVKPPKPTSALPHFGRYPRIYWAIALAALVGVSLIGLNWSANSNEEASIAVLPFNNYTEKVQTYLSEGMADGLISQLGSVQDLRVASRASSFALKKELSQGEIDVAEIHNRLRVRYIVEGSILPGDHPSSTTISVRLVDARRDAHVWADQWNTQDTSIITIQTEIAKAVADVLHPGTSKTTLVAQPVTNNAPAYESYLRGRDYLRQPANTDVLIAARESFEEALRLDANFAGAYAGLCETHLAFYKLNLDSIPFALSLQTCTKALDLQPNLWEVNLALAALHRESGNYEKSLAVINQARATRPNVAEVYTQLGFTLDRQGKQIAAESAFLKAIELDPGYWRVYKDLGNFYFDHVEYTKALDVFNSILSMVSDNTNVLSSIGAAQLSSGKFADALKTYDAVKLKQKNPRRTTLTNLGITHYYSGCFDEAAYWQRQAFDLAPRDHRVAGRLAESCRFVEGKDEAALNIWQLAINLAKADRNQADWENKGLVAVYHSHRGEIDQATVALGEMWELSPERSIGYYFAAIVARKRGAVDVSKIEVKRALQAGFPPALIINDPDLNPVKQCSLPSPREINTSVCKLDI